MAESTAAGAVEFARKNGERFVEELKALLRIPSISTLPEHAPDVRRAAEFIAAELRRIGMENVELIETVTTDHPHGHPLVYADWLHAGAGAPTVLCYGHYDVQPAEPLDEWITPPFEPTERNGNLYARGAVDDKGQMWMHVKALESLFAANQGRFAGQCQGSDGGRRRGRGRGHRVVCTRAWRPTSRGCRSGKRYGYVRARSSYALCGSARHDLHRDRGARSEIDLHSGMYGGAAPNPFIALAQIIAKLKDEDGRILIPGFHDKIVPPSSEEKATWSRAGL